MIKGSIPVNWRAFPFLRLVFPFILGIVLSEYFDLIQDIWTTCLLTCFLLGFLLISIRKKFSNRYHLFIGFIVNIILFLLGFIGFQLNNPANYPSYFKRHVSKSEVDILLRVDDYKVQEKWIKVFGNVREVIDSSNKYIKTQGKLLVYLQPQDINPEYGQIINLRLKLIPVPGIKNPHVFDYKKYLENQNVYYEGFCKSDKWNLVDRYEHTIKTYANQCMKTMLQLLKKHLGDKEEYAVGSALLFGYRNGISDELNNAYIQTGAIHILAVSGLHVGIISGLLSLLLGFIKRNSINIRLLKLGIILIFLWGFVFIAGASGSIIRAAVMFSIIHTGSLLLHRRYLYNTLASSAFLVLIVEPKMLFDIGFQLSYLAVIGIISIQPLLLKIWKPTNKFLVLFWEIFTITIAAQIATLPLILYYFHQTSVYFLIAGIIVVPISTLAMYAGIGLFVSNLILPFLSIYFGKIMYYCLHLMNKIVFSIQAIPGNLVDHIPFSGLETGMMLMFIFGLIFSILKRNKTTFFISLSILVILLAFRSFLIMESHHQQLITFYSSKQGISIDYFNGQECYQFSEHNLTTEDKYTNRNNRIKGRINSYLPIDYRDSFSRHEITLSANKLNIQDTQFFFLENKSLSSYGIDTSGNVYVLNDINPNDLRPNKSTYLLILNPIMSYRLRNEWKTWALKYNIRLVDLKLGSLTINLRK